MLLLFTCCCCCTAEARETGVTMEFLKLCCCCDGRTGSRCCCYEKKELYSCCQEKKERLLVLYQLLLRNDVADATDLLLLVSVQRRRMRGNWSWSFCYSQWSLLLLLRVQRKTGERNSCFCCTAEERTAGEAGHFHCYSQFKMALLE
ncbi:hypothetical protein NC652_039100 [Populus alba x Populus x berolinensis]|nr:hypothetical protein NC652_039100 [Populus alba x Populus x berolinensis]